MYYRKGRTVTANLTGYKSGNEQREDRNELVSGGWYDLEIVREYTKENRARFALDETRYINGRTKIVSKQRMYVASVMKTGHEYKLECRGTDRYGRSDDGTFIYYLSPESAHRAETYIFSFTRILGTYDR